MARIPAPEFERALRRELVRHEDRRRARLGDAAALAASEALFVREVVRAAGYGDAGLHGSTRMRHSGR